MKNKNKSNEKVLILRSEQIIYVKTKFGRDNRVYQEYN